MPRIAHSLDQRPALVLLGSVPVGRVAFTRNALPAMCAVHHMVDDGVIIVRSHRQSALVSYASTTGAVVAYEADDVDKGHRLAWSVLVTGIAQIVQDPGLVAGYERQVPCLGTGTRDYFLTIQPSIVNGYILSAAPPNGDGETADLAELEPFDAKVPPHWLEDRTE